MLVEVNDANEDAFLVRKVRSLGGECLDQYVVYRNGLEFLTIITSGLRLVQTRHAQFFKQTAQTC